MEGDTPAETAEFDRVADVILTRSGPATPQELYGWLRGLLPEQLRRGLLHEARRLQWPYIPEDLPESVLTPRARQSLMRDHAGGADFQETLRTMWTERQQAGIIPAESSGNQVITHIGLQPYNEALVMAAARLHDAVPNLINRWESQDRSQGVKRAKKGNLEVRDTAAAKAERPQNL